jgi:hypothetical protein
MANKLLNLNFTISINYSKGAFMKTKIFTFTMLSVLFLIQSFSYAQLPIPTNLTATEISWMNHSVVKLQWDGAGNMERYNVYKKLGGINQTGDFLRIAHHIMHRDFIDPMVLPDSTYSYYVTSVSQTGESDPSNTVEITLNGTQALASVTGTLTNEVNNEPIPNGKIRFNTENTCYGITSYTNELGEFVVHLLPGNYYVRSMAMGYYSEFYDNVPNIQQATLVTLNAGDSINFNISLAPFVPPVVYLLSGTVTDNSGNPLQARIMVSPVRMNSYFNHHFGRHTFTDSLGNYSVPVREGDTVIVFCKPLNRDYLPEYFDNKQTYTEADRVPITGDVTEIDFALDPVPVYENGISGIVKNENAEGIESHITAFNLDGNHIMRYRTVTDSLGVYGLSNLNPGEYILLAIPTDEYMPTFFRYDGQQALNWRDADSVVVETAGIISDINFTVRPFVFEGYANVTGIVKDNAGNNIIGAMVFAVDENNNIRSYAISNSLGQFVMEGFEPGNYRIIGDKFGFNSNQLVNVALNYNANLSQSISLTLTPEGVTSVSNEIVVENYSLNQNYPNPFNPFTSIQYSITSSELVTLKIIDILGREVATLVNEQKPAGIYQIQFDASELTSGVYFYKLQAGSFTETKKMILMK